MDVHESILKEFGTISPSEAERLREYFAAEIEQEIAQKAREQNEKEIEKRVLAKMAQEEKERYRKELELERLREKDISQLPVLDVSVSTVKRLFQGKYPLFFLELPASIIAILEDAFQCAGQSELLSKYCSCLISQLGHAWNSEKRRETLEKLGDIPGARYEVPILVSIVGGGKSIEMMELGLIAWSLAYQQVKEEKLALVHA